MLLSPSQCRPSDHARPARLTARMSALPRTPSPSPRPATTAPRRRACPPRRHRIFVLPQSRLSDPSDLPLPTSTLAVSSPLTSRCTTPTRHSTIIPCLSKLLPRCSLRTPVPPRTAPLPRTSNGSRYNGTCANAHPSPRAQLVPRSRRRASRP